MVMTPITDLLGGSTECGAEGGGGASDFIKGIVVPKLLPVPAVHPSVITSLKVAHPE
jgi:hypothetical protein